MSLPGLTQTSIYKFSYKGRDITNSSCDIVGLRGRRHTDYVAGLILKHSFVVLTVPQGSEISADSLTQM
jgi:hypothetical protein